jgi:hypothetical protein
LAVTEAGTRIPLRVDAVDKVRDEAGNAHFALAD